MRLIVSIFLMVLLVQSVRGAGADAPLVLAPAPEKLSVVHTVADLAGQPPIMLGTDEAHMGMSADTAPAGSAILIYCRMESVTERQLQWDDDGQALGPFSVSVTAKARRVVRLKANRAMAAPASDSPVLFIAAAYLESPGDYQIVVRSMDGPVATADVHATDAEAPVWSSLKPAADHGGANRFERAEGGVIPHWGGESSHVLPEDSAVLPSFLPDKPAADFVAVADGERITLSRWPDAEFDIPNQLLVRFWVNGKPVAPAPATRVAFIVRSGRAPAPPEHVQFSLAVTAADLGAAPADKIEMQLLLSPDGYDRPNMRLINVARRITAAAPLPVLSNRITLALPAATEPAGAKSP